LIEIISAELTLTATPAPKKIEVEVAAKANLWHPKHLRELYEKSQSETLPPMETVFTDMALLEKTLKEHGLSTSVVSDNQLLCQIGDALLDYSRQTAGEPFKVTISGQQNIDGFFNEMECFEREYKQNVQSYTYNKLMENVKESNMKIADETVLKDNSILLTVDI